MDPVLQEAVISDAVECHADLEPGVVVIGISRGDAIEEIPCALAVGLWQAKQGSGVRLMALHLLEQQGWRLGDREVSW